MPNDMKKLLININAIILAIIIASLTTYYVYQAENYNKIIETTISEAEKINQLRFVRSAYNPSGGQKQPSRDNNGINIAIRYLLNIEILNVTLQWKKPRSEWDVNLFKNYELPETPEDSGELILRNLNIVTHSYPFPEDMKISDNGVSKGVMPEPLYFKNLNEVKKWFDDFDRILNVSLSFPEMFESEPNIYEKFLLPLKAKMQKEYSGLEKELVPGRLGVVDPLIIIKDFYKNLNLAYELRNRVRYQLERAVNYKKNIFDKTPIIIFICLSGLIFVLGVFFPIFYDATHSVFYAAIPFTFYMYVFFYVINEILMFSYMN